MIEKIKQLNENRKFFKKQETEFYDWNKPEGFQVNRNMRKIIEKQIFNLIEQLKSSKKMKVKIKKLVENAVLPKYSRDGDAGMDLTAVGKELLDSEHIKYSFGLSMEIPRGYVGLIFPRSSCYKKRQILSNCVGVVDSGYRGEISAVMIGTSEHSYEVGDRVAQLIIMPYPEIEFEEVEELSSSERGENGYGSTGLK